MFKTSGAIRGDPGKMLVRGSFGLVRGSSVARPWLVRYVRGSSVAHSGSSVARPWVNHGKSVANSGSSGLIRGSSCMVRHGPGSIGLI